MNSFNNLLTRDDCENLLEQKLKTNQFKLINYSILSSSDTMDGFMGYHLRLKCEILLNETNETKQVTFFVKKQIVNLIDDETVMECLRSCPSERKEMLFYSIIADVPTEQIQWAPKCYPYKKDNSILILDDLREYGFVMLRETVCNLQESKAILKALAQMHTFSIKYEAEKTKELGKPWTFYDAYGMELFEDVLFDGKNKFSENWFEQSSDALKYEFDFYDSARAEFLKEQLDKIVPKLYNLYKPSKQFRNVMCHGDIWTKNVMLKYNENQVAEAACIIDFQLVRYLPPAHDVAMTLYVATTPELRKAHLQELLDFYHEAFANELKLNGFDVDDICPKLDFEQSFKEYMLAGKITAAMYRQTISAGEDFLTKYLDTKCKALEFLLFDRVKYLLPLRENKEFVENFSHVIYELCEILTSDDILREHCNQVIVRELNTNDFNLEHFHLKTHTQTNVCIEQKILNILITYKNQKLAFDYFVKLPSKCNRIKQINLEDLINREIFMYRYIFKEMSNVNKLPINQIIPKYYHGIKNNFIILENLSKQGFKTIESYDKLNYEHIKLVIQTLAKFHAASFIHETKMSLNSYAQSNKNSIYNKNFIENIFNIIITILNELFPDEKQLNKIKNVIKSFENSYANYLKPSTTYKNVLCHNNLQQNNLMFKYNSKSEPIECRLINLHKCCYLPPAVDIITLLYSTDVTLRNNYYDDILNLYYMTFKIEVEQSSIINIDDILTYSELLESIKEMEMFIVFQRAINSLLMLINQKFLNSSSNNNIIDLDIELHGEVLKENLKFNPKCKELIKETHLALINHCINYISK